MSERHGISVEEIFDTMGKRFRPEGAEGLNESYGYDIEEKGKWKLEIRDGSMTVGLSDDLSDCICVMKADADSFVGTQIGKVDWDEAFSSGKISVDGNRDALDRTKRMFKKFTAPGEDVEGEQELVVLRKIISVDQKFATGPVMGKFLKGLKEKKILANKCRECGKLQLPPKEICGDCRVRCEEFVEVGPRGNVRMMDLTLFASPDPLTGETRETPYGTVFILLDGCKGNETFTHYIRPDQMDRIEMGWNEKKGTIVRPVWAEERTGHVYDIKYFEIDE